MDVLVVVGGCSGAAAAIQAARLTARTLVCEETRWPGGMLTSAGAAAGSAVLAGEIPRDVYPAVVQDQLIAGGCQVVSDRDRANTDPEFEKRQRQLLNGK